MSQFPDAKQLFTTVTEDGKSILSIEPYAVPEPKEHEVVVQMEAVPINPSDLGLLTAAANMDTVRSETVDGHPALVADVDAAMQPFFKGRAGKKMAAGNEGAGTVVAAGSSDAAQALMGKVVTIVGGEMYRTHRVMPAMMCVPLPEGAPAKEGASLFVNPMTAQGFLNTMRAEGHEGLVHTAAASNLGQMLAKLCLKEGVPLVAIVRSDAQKKILTDIGLTHVIDSSKDDFMEQLIAALAETGATLGFDAIGGGKMASYILTAMEKAAAVRGAEFSVYGSTVNKQVYIYGRLDTGETILGGGLGLYWGVGGWLLTPHLEKVGMERMMEMRMYTVEERNGIFNSDYSSEISLMDMIDPETAKGYEKKATGEKVLVNPSL
ncbi:MAG: NADH oxidase [Sphingomonadales bacterium]|nr:NADH oxidase [Sphingomonadales bacterium]NCO49554.1 NADH oxidase [Sphingomonadales bacterium]NCP01147.1 NADH oxidase [Sphingomonadales bacterium]NCP42837.1 NADH oxidase [Sphingomonadales bacterium]NCQ08649.1 NADH oxidase [Sphingomonadales bacterium]